MKSILSHDGLATEGPLRGFGDSTGEKITDAGVFPSGCKDFLKDVKPFPEVYRLSIGLEIVGLIPSHPFVRKCSVP